MASPPRHIGICTTAAHRQPLAGGGLEAVITGVAHQACSFHADWVRDCASGSTGARSRNLRTRRAGGQYTQPSRKFGVQPPRKSGILQAAQAAGRLGFAARLPPIEPASSTAADLTLAPGRFGAAFVECCPVRPGFCGVAGKAVRVRSPLPSADRLPPAANFRFIRLTSLSARALFS